MRALGARPRLTRAAAVGCRIPHQLAAEFGFCSRSPTRAFSCFHVPVPNIPKSFRLQESIGWICGFGCPPGFGARVAFNSLVLEMTLLRISESLQLENSRHQ
jgi:hypothetical protein